MTGSRDVHGGSDFCRKKKSGLTLVEVMAAILVLAVGLLALAAEGGWMIRSAYAAQDRLGRIAALQTTVEEVSAIPFGELAPGRTSQGDFEVSWTLKDQRATSALVEFVAVGPLRTRRGARRIPAAFRLVADTLHYRSAPR